MIISISAVGLFLFKLIILFLVAGFSATMVLWPINDQPTSKGQWFVWSVINMFMVCVVFGFITFEA